MRFSFDTVPPPCDLGPGPRTRLVSDRNATRTQLPCKALSETGQPYRQPAAEGCFLSWQAGVFPAPTCTAAAAPTAGPSTAWQKSPQRLVCMYRRCTHPWWRRGRPQGSPMFVFSRPTRNWVSTWPLLQCYLAVERNTKCGGRFLLTRGLCPCLRAHE